MGFVSITSINADGVTTKDLSELTDSERLDIELDLFLNAKVTLLCVTCKTPIESGLGHCYCPRHTPERYRKQCQRVMVK